MCAAFRRSPIDRGARWALQSFGADEGQISFATAREVHRTFAFGPRPQGHLQREVLYARVRSAKSGSGNRLGGHAIGPAWIRWCFAAKRFWLAKATRALRSWNSFRPDRARQIYDQPLPLAVRESGGNRHIEERTQLVPVGLCFQIPAQEVIGPILEVGFHLRCER